MNPRLTKQQRKVLNELLASRPNKQAAGNLNISVKTIEKHRQEIYHKYGVNTLLDALRIALLCGDVDFDWWLRIETPFINYRERSMSGQPPDRASQLSRALAYECEA